METQARIETHTIRIDPRELKLLDVNARYMRHEVYQRLIKNIQRDGGLTGNTPFAWRVHDDDTQTPSEPPVYLVISGNHRVKASIDAGLDSIEVTVTDDYLTPDRRKAIQLSHNALTGEDDPAVLKTIYESIGDVELRLYSGLDDKQLQLLADVSASALSEATLQFQHIGLTFLPHEVEQVNAVWDDVRKQIKNVSGYWVGRWGDYDRAMDALEATQSAYNIKNTATALMVMLDIFYRHLNDLQEGFIDAQGEPYDPKQQVPVIAVLGVTLPARVAAKIKKLGTDPLTALEALLDTAPNLNK